MKDLTQVSRLMLITLNELVKNDPASEQDRFIICDDNRQALTDIKHYLARVDGNLDYRKGILFHGSVGTGKTLMVECMRICMQELWGKVLTVMTAPYIKSNYYEKDIDMVSIPRQVAFYRFLAINDIGMERDYASGENIIQNILFERYEKRFFTFGTTNLDLSEFFNRYADEKGRMSDRYKSMFNYIELVGKTFR